MNTIKKLAGQTAMYGLSSMLGRFLNYLLVPLHTARFIPEQYGAITELYALAAFGMIVLSFGLETAFFRFVNESKQNEDKVLSNTLGFLSLNALLFLGFVAVFNANIADSLGYTSNPEYILLLGMALAFDTLAAIPLALLRKQERPIRFALINLGSTAINILLNVFFIGYCMGNTHLPSWIAAIYNPEWGIAYVFFANAVASAFKALLLWPAIRHISWRFDPVLLKTLLIYAFPLMLAGLAGIINETLDRRLIRVILEPKIGETAALAQVGIYGACYKLSLIISLFIQAFRYAAEPFFFAKSKDEDARNTYAETMIWFTLAVSAMMLFVLLYLDIFKLFIRSEVYWVGLHIVPILLMANIFLGWTYNLSIWYKLSNNTRFGAYLAIFGAVITVTANYALVPTMGYTGSAWATLAAYGSIAVASFLIGQKKYYIPYDLKRILAYPFFALALYALSRVFTFSDSWLKYGVNTVILVVFLLALFKLEKKRIQRIQS
jgi:O-antigen/teichoic acid export membrane protein